MSRFAVLAAFAALALPGLAPAKPMFQPWIDGTSGSEAQTQTQRYDRDTYVIRQSVKTNFEAPFLYLLFGRDRALLIDTGAGGLKIRPTVDAAIGQWLAEHHRASIPLVVAHSHSHGDHRMGDAEFRDRPETVVVGWTAPEVAAFFKIVEWPKNAATFDLGGRALGILPTPGHHPSHIMVFDPKTRWLISGDTLYPGRLYIPDGALADYRASVDRAVAFTRSRQVSHVMGAHVEMSREAGKDYRNAAPTHPDEHALELPYADLLELQAAVHAMGDTPARDVHRDFIVFPLPPRPKT